MKSVKYHLLRVTESALFTSEETTTLLYQIKAELNSRPMVPMSNDPTDFTVLTLAQFLVGGPTNSTHSITKIR